MSRTSGERDPEILRFRTRLAAADRAILAAVGTRVRLAVEMLAYKAQRGLPLVDDEQERRVRERCRGSASEEGVDPDLAWAVMELVVAAGKETGFARYGP